MSRRRYGKSYYRQGPARHTSKVLKAVALAPGTTQDTLDLINSSVAGTVSGFRWDFTIRGTTSAIARVGFVIVHLRDGSTLSTMSLTDGADLYAPEEDVLCFGYAVGSDSDATGVQFARLQGVSSAKRKIKQGDKIVIVAISTVVASALDGIFQCFITT